MSATSLESKATDLAADIGKLGATALRIKEERDEMAEALKLIAAMGNKTLLGGHELESHRAHELGAHKAFKQAADIAREALTKAGVS